MPIGPMDRLPRRGEIARLARLQDANEAPLFPATLEPPVFPGVPAPPSALEPSVNPADSGLLAPLEALTLPGPAALQQDSLSTTAEKAPGKATAKSSAAVEKPEIVPPEPNLPPSAPAAEAKELVPTAKESTEQPAQAQPIAVKKENDYIKILTKDNVIDMRLRGVIYCLADKGIA